MRSIVLITLFCLSYISLQAQIPDIIWTKKYGGSEVDVASEVHQTSDGGYVFVGETFSFGSGDSDIWLVRTNSDGDVIWSKTRSKLMNLLSHL